MKLNPQSFAALIFAFGSAFAPMSAHALDLPSTCIAPAATATSITGINTRHAAMAARYTLPDIVQACYQGYVDQGGSQPPERLHCHTSEFTKCLTAAGRGRLRRWDCNYRGTSIRAADARGLCQRRYSRHRDIQAPMPRLWRKDRDALMLLL